MTTTKRTNRIDVRVTPEAKKALQAAAALRRTTVSDFVLDSALKAADDELAERTVFPLSAEQWEAFHQALDAPPQSKPRLNRLLQEPGAFD